MSVKFTPNILRLQITIFSTGAGPKLVSASFLPIKWHDHICTIGIMSFKSALNRSVHIIGKVIHFVQLGNLHVRVHFDVMDDLAVVLVVGTLSIHRLVKTEFPMERHLSPSSLAHSQIFQNTRRHRTRWLCCRVTTGK